MPQIQARVSEGMKAEVEHIVGEVGLWENESYFIREALNEYIKKHWKWGDRYCQNVHPKKGF
ncbi:MAG: hypothetical protein JRI65_14805 [Deltaproteobacteria bacterium]|nr:hypothetical protein [Deltaproteobacteria bacterium]